MTPKTEANPKPANVEIIIDYSQFNPDRADVILKINGSQVRTHQTLKLLQCLDTVTGILREYPDAEIIDATNPRTAEVIKTLKSV